jgi:hypothetical protein
VQDTTTFCFYICCYSVPSRLFHAAVTSYLGCTSDIWIRQCAFSAPLTRGNLSSTRAFYHQWRLRMGHGMEPTAWHWVNLPTVLKSAVCYYEPRESPPLSLSCEWSRIAVHEPHITRRGTTSSECDWNLDGPHGEPTHRDKALSIARQNIGFCCPRPTHHRTFPSCRVG